MIWSHANSQSYSASRLRDIPNRTASAYSGALQEAQCTSDCVVKGGRNSAYCDSQCRFGAAPLTSQMRARAPLAKIHGPALDYDIPYANYGPYYNGYPVPTFPRAVRLMRGVASPQSSPINVPAPLNGIALISGQSGCQQLPNGGWRCPQ